ncbi:glycosyltransferase [Candidatus Woesearchaeota archaeon]|nr:glycosyltransferase [Candidatus Woesearchaeota archaeon]
MEQNKLTICAFGGYDPEYGRNINILEGLQLNDINIIECNNRSNILLRQYRLIKQFLKLDKSKINAIYVAHPGITEMPLAWLLSKLYKKPLIYDVFISGYNTVVESRKLVKPKTLKSLMYWLADKYSCKLADCVLLDTIQHINYFVNEFKLNRNLFRRVFVGVNDKLFYPRTSSRNDNDLVILFHGTFIPGHGLKIILDTAKMLEQHPDIKFLVAGKGQLYDEVINYSKTIQNNNVKFLGLVPYQQIPELIADSDICLGLFDGSIAKVCRVVPNKAYEIVAMKKPFITADCLGIKEVFTNLENVVLCDLSSAKSLKDSILLLKNNPSLRNTIAENSYNLMMDNYTRKHIGKIVKNILEELIPGQPS